MVRWAVGAVALALGLSLAAAGCSPPKVPNGVGVKDVPTDVNIGPRETTTTTVPVSTTAAGTPGSSTSRPPAPVGP